MSKLPRHARIALTIGIWSLVATMIVFSAMNTIVLHVLGHDRAYMVAVLADYSQNPGLRGLKASSEKDPAFQENGLLTAEAKPSRCAAGLAALNAFQKRWLDAPEFKGHRIHTHFVAAELAGVYETIATRNGCMSSSSFYAFLLKVQSIRESDSRVHDFSDVAIRFPLLGHDGNWPVFATVQGLNELQWAAGFNDDRLPMRKCEIDPSCDPTAMVKQAASLPQKG